VSWAAATRFASDTSASARRSSADVAPGNRSRSTAVRRLSSATAKSAAKPTSACRFPQHVQPEPVERDDGQVGSLRAKQTVQAFPHLLAGAAG